MACCLRHQAITWTNVDLSPVKSHGFHLGAILSLEDLKKPIKKNKIENCSFKMARSPRGQWVNLTYLNTPLLHTVLGNTILVTQMYDQQTAPCIGPLTPMNYPANGELLLVITYFIYI